MATDTDVRSGVADRAGGPLRLLIVEDLPDDAELIAYELRRSGYDLSWRRVDNPDELASALAGESWDIVLSDYSMPGFSGMDALLMVKASGLDVPFILVSGAVGEEVAVEVMRAGACDYVLKGRLGRLGPAIARELHDARERQARRAAERQVHTLTWVIEQSPTVVIVTDLEGRIRYANPRFTALTGYTLSEVLGETPALLKSGEMSGAAYEALWRTIKGGQEWRGVFHNRRRDGTLYWESAAICPLRDENGRITYFVKMAEDISEQRRAEEALRRSRDELQAANAQLRVAIRAAQSASRAKSEFLANISHEIRTPMNGVIGMTGLLLNTPLTAEQRQFAEIVRSSGESLLRLVNDILDFSKIEARKLELEVLDFDLRATVEETIDMFAVKAQEKGLDLTCLVSPGMPVQLRGDPGRLRQILSNLVGNAIKFTPAGDVSVDVACTREDEKLAAFRFAIRDTGIGIPADRMDRLFTSFSQVDGSSSRRYGGTGLGLAISKELVQMMGGEIGVESEPDKGSTFWFTAVFEKQPGSDAAAEGAPVRFDGVRALVVDDHAPNRLLVSTLLTSWGCRTSEAVDGPSALAALRDAARRDDPFRVAFLDMHMPGMDGEVLAVQIKADPDISGTLLIMLTSMGERTDSLGMTRLGFARCLSKPVRATQLHEALAAALGLGSDAAGALPPGVEEPPQADRSRFLILLAEDNPTNQLVALGLLKKLGYRADAVADGTEVLDALRTIRYDLVLMDCQMPEMDGFAAAKAIRQTDSGAIDPHIPIIALTARAMQGDRERCLQAGMDDYLPKPIGPDDLARVLDRWLRLGQPRQPSAPIAVPPPTAPVFDAADLLHRLLGDRPLAESFIEVFAQEVPAQLAAMRQSLAAGDSIALRRQAHGLKGAAANVSAELVRESASAIERLAAAGDLTEASPLLARLEGELEELLGVLRREGWLAAASSDAAAGPA